MESTAELLSKPFALVSLNTLNPITYKGTLRDCLKVRRNLLKENDKLIFRLYEKVEYQHRKQR